MNRNELTPSQKLARAQTFLIWAYRAQIVASLALIAVVIWKHT